MYAHGSNCAYCKWPIDFAMGEGLNVAINNHKIEYRWMHSLCADYARGCEAA